MHLLQTFAARLATVAVAASIGCVPCPAPAAETAPSSAELIASVAPAVVSISIVNRDTTDPIADNIASQPTATEHTTQSSGFFIAPSGIIVTNRHVILGASEITVTLQDATRLRACVIASAGQSDIALLRVNPGRPVPTLAFGDSDGMRRGDPVFVIGNPLGLGGTVTSGIVSALGRDTPDSGFGPFFQIDASLNHGSSGGPVFDADGKVIGVATALYSPGGETGSVGLGLAIPASDAKFIVEQLLTNGRVRLGWIGVHTQPVTADLAAAVGLPTAVGSMITDIDEDGPAARAGLAVGDVILRVGDGDLRGPRSLNRAIAAGTIGSVTKLVVWRDGADRTVPVVIPVVIEESPADQAAAAKQVLPVPCDGARATRRDLGLVVAPLTLDARARLGLPARQAGALVADVLPDTPAADRGIVAGAVILNVNRHAVAAPADVQAGIDAARTAGRGSVLVLVRDPQGLRWVALAVEGGATPSPRPAP